MFHELVERDDAANMAKLLQLGADPKAASTAGTMCIHDACRKTRADMVQLLIAFGEEREVDVGSTVVNDDHTPLMLAVAAQSVPLCRILLTGAAVRQGIDCVTPVGTALHLAIRAQNLELVQLLHEHGAQVNVPPGGSRTPPMSVALTAATGVLERDDADGMVAAEDVANFLAPLLVAPDAVMFVRMQETYLYRACALGLNAVVRTLLETLATLATQGAITPEEHHKHLDTPTKTRETALSLAIRQVGGGVGVGLGVRWRGCGMRWGCGVVWWVRNSGGVGVNHH